jgi:hypothetical protein
VSLATLLLHCLRLQHSCSYRKRGRVRRTQKLSGGGRLSANCSQDAPPAVR